MKTEACISVGARPRAPHPKTRLGAGLRRLALGVAVLLGLGALSACGQKGPLRLPAPASAASAASAAR